jgi:threonine/homoserine/homoserine lactone efflux protein
MLPSGKSFAITANPFTEFSLLDEIGVLYRGIVLGLVIAAPVGPVGLLCIRRSLQKGMVVGLATGLGAACADALFGAIAVLGVGAILDFIHHYAATIRLIGGAIVLFTAWHTWRDQPERKPRQLVNRVLHIAEERTSRASIRATLSGFIITVTNPLTLFGTLAVVATFGGITRRIEADVMILGIFLGSLLWWFCLSGGVSLFRHHFTESRIGTLNRITAVALGVLGGWAVYSGIHGYMR